MFQTYGSVENFPAFINENLSLKALTQFKKVAFSASQKTVNVKGVEKYPRTLECRSIQESVHPYFRGPLTLNKNSYEFPEPKESLSYRKNTAKHKNIIITIITAFKKQFLNVEGNDRIN